MSPVVGINNTGASASKTKVSSTVSAALSMIDGARTSVDSISNGNTASIGMLKPRKNKKRGRSVEFSVNNSGGSSGSDNSVSSSTASSPCDGESSTTSSCDTSHSDISHNSMDMSPNDTIGADGIVKPPRVPCASMAGADDNLVTPHKRPKSLDKLSSDGHNEADVLRARAATPNSSNVIDALSLLINSKCAGVDESVRKKSFDIANGGTDDEDCSSNKSRTSSFGSDIATSKKPIESVSVSVSGDMEIDTNVSPSLITDLPSHSAIGISQQASTSKHGTVTTAGGILPVVDNEYTISSDVDRLIPNVTAQDVALV